MGRIRVSTLVRWHGKSGATGVESTIHSRVNTNGISPPLFRPGLSRPTLCLSFSRSIPRPFYLPLALRLAGVSDFCLRYRVTHRTPSLRIRRYHHSTLAIHPWTPPRSSISIARRSCNLDPLKCDSGWSRLRLRELLDGHLGSARGIDRTLFFAWIRARGRMTNDQPAALTIKPTGSLPSPTCSNFEKCSREADATRSSNPAVHRQEEEKGLRGVLSRRRGWWKAWEFCGKSEGKLTFLIDWDV